MCICVLIILCALSYDICPHTMCVLSYSICVHIRVLSYWYCYVCVPHTTIYMSSNYMCPHTTTYVSSYCYTQRPLCASRCGTCVLILYMCPCILLYTCPHTATRSGHSAQAVAAVACESTSFVARVDVDPQARLEKKINAMLKKIKKKMKNANTAACEPADTTENNYNNALLMRWVVVQAAVFVFFLFLFLKA